MIRVEELCKAFEERAVLRDVTFSVAEGEIVSLLGPSGCGKTTLLRILAELEPQDSGVWQAAGEGLGYLAQSRELLKWRTLRDNVALGMEYQRYREEDISKRCEELLSSVCLSEAMDLYPEQVSGGMSRRALLAQLLATDPSILLLDEPLAGLDVHGRRNVSELLRSYIHGKKRAALVVTHSIEDAVYMSDQVLLFGTNPASVEKRIRFSNSNRSDLFGEILEHFSKNPSAKEYTLCVG